MTFMFSRFTGVAAGSEGSACMRAVREAPATNRTRVEENRRADERGNQ
jgi:hypothetical protein